MTQTGLIPGLLGGEFAALAPGVRAVHGGANGEWQGRASVQRGRSALAIAVAALTRLPPTVIHVPTIVRIEVDAQGERWIRRFGAARPMTSRLWALDGELLERLGMVTLRYRLRAIAGGIDWVLQGVSWLGVPLPRNALRVRAQSSPSESGYRFEVSVHLWGIGPLIRYEGELETGGA